MIVGSVKENTSIDKRVSITPETAKNINNLGLEIYLEKNYAIHIGIPDKDYKNVKFFDDQSELIKNSNLLAQVNCPSSKLTESLKENSIVLGMLNPNNNKELLVNLLKKKINSFSLELLPRITRAQSMDVLSSQANLAGYRAVIESIFEFEKAIPMMMTAAGTVPAAKVLVIGAGVAGLQAIATAKRLGAIVSATDVRAASKEQVESLGGKFLTVEGSENLETKEGYAKEAGKDFKKKQAEMLEKAASNSDIIICTALIPGKPAPRIISEKMVARMRQGSVIFDLAVTQGGNAAYSEEDKTVIKNGVKIIGISNVMNRLPVTASSLYAKNIFSFIRNLYSKEKKQFILNMQDEIIKSTLIKGDN